jgi:hypothetical protein
MGQLKKSAGAIAPEVLKRFETISNAISQLDKCIKLLKEDEADSESMNSIKLKEGRYLAENQHLKAELRIDITSTNVISMDIFMKSAMIKSYLASLRTNPGSELKENLKEFSIICEDKTGKVVQGLLSFFPSNEKKTKVELVLKESIEGLPVNTKVLLDAIWKSKHMREIGLETETEAGLREISPYEFNGKNVTVKSCFREAGIILKKAGGVDNIPAVASGWDEAQLHGLLTQFADNSLNKADWMLHLLLLSKSKMEGLLGVMFDTGQSDINGFPRQGAAIFLNEIEGHPAGTKRKSIQTTVHELGHALNLAHRFEREVGRADSTSFMNYDWRYKGDSNGTKYWKDFKFTFDLDEIRFMRHAPWWKVVPGGIEFHTVKYWNEGSGGYSPYAPEIPITDMELELMPPATGSLFGFATPVYLEVRLTNRSNKKLNIPKYYLDPKAGILEILIKRISGNADYASNQSFKPIISRCFDVQKDGKDILKPNDTMTNNINLTFGSAGFTFAEPGNYEITALLSLWDDRYNYIVRSNALQIRIAYPKNKEEELDALKIFSRDVGFYMALGGTDILPEAEKKLIEVKERRLRIDKTISDPLVAYITRYQAINQSRDFISFKDGKYKIRKAESAKVSELLDQLKPNEAKIFDKVTLESTRNLLKTRKN